MKGNISRCFCENPVWQRRVTSRDDMSHSLITHENTELNYLNYANDFIFAPQYNIVKENIFWHFGENQT